MQCIIYLHMTLDKMYKLMELMQYQWSKASNEIAARYIQRKIHDLQVDINTAEAAEIKKK